MWKQGQVNREYFLFLGPRSLIKNKKTSSSDKHIELEHCFDLDLTFRMYSYIFKSNR